MMAAVALAGAVSIGGRGWPSGEVAGGIGGRTWAGG